MSDAGMDAGENEGGTEGALHVSIARPGRRVDFATVIGLIFSGMLIVSAIYMGSSKANFFNLPSVFIVIFGTAAVTCVSYSWNELRMLGKILSQTLFRRTITPSMMAKQLIDLASIARKRGILALAGLDDEISKDPFLFRSVQLVTDGYTSDDVDRLLGQEVDSLIERHKRGANIFRRGAEIAPAMGLIGTLVGLVKMLADLSNPESIGPAMALALLTTFYGAILGTVVLSPLAAKLEKNSSDEAKIKNLILVAMDSIVRQENPRRLEMLLNSVLSPHERIQYFD